MKLFFSFVFALLAFTACTKPEKEVYIFTSHREPALDGLHSVSYTHLTLPTT